MITISTRPLASVQVTADRMHETHAELTAEWTGEAHGGKAAPRDLEPARRMARPRQERNAFTFRGTEVVFFALGTQCDTFTGTDTLESDGTQRIVITGRYTGGTGPYRGASGRYRFTGSVPPGSTVLRAGSTGVVAF